MLPDKVKETIRRFGMLEPGDRVLVAVSGGPDSVCLLSALHSLSAELGITLHIAHLDHMFRGKESEDEANFVDALARRLGIPSTIDQIDVPAFCREHGLPPQAGAREVRYAFFTRVAAATGSDRIATGHTATDQAETMLMRLMRGAGVTGLSAIPPVRDNIIRPLIDLTRDEVLEHLRAADTPFVTDPSNAKPLYTRNRIRMEIMPVLKRFNPRIENALASEAGLLRDEDEAINHYLETIAEPLITREENVLSVKRKDFNALPLAFRRRIFRKIAGAVAEPSTLSLAQIDEALFFMAAAQTGRTMSLPRGLSIGREYDRFVVNIPADMPEFSFSLTAPGITVISELGLEVETAIADGNSTFSEAKNYLWQAMFDYDKIGPFLTLRNRRPGDWFRPSGMGGRSKKLQDYLVDEKVSRRKRDRIPLLCAGNNILWVVGFRTDERFAAGPDAKTTLVVRISGNS